MPDSSQSFTNSILTAPDAVQPLDSNSVVPVIQSNRTTKAPATTLGQLVCHLAMPTTGQSITILSSAPRLILSPSGTLSSLAVRFPPAPIDGQVIEIMSSQDIVSLVLSSTDGSTINGADDYSLAANTGASWVYQSENTTWFVRY